MNTRWGMRSDSDSPRPDVPQTNQSPARRSGAVSSITRARIASSACVAKRAVHSVEAAPVRCSSTNARAR